MSCKAVPEGSNVKLFLLQFTLLVTLSALSSVNWLPMQNKVPKASLAVTSKEVSWLLFRLT